MYDTREEASQKLEGSVVLFDGSPVMITGTGGSKNKVFLSWSPIPYRGQSQNESTLINDPRWNFKALGQRLGYVDVETQGTGIRETVFLSRIPTRHSRQGLDSRTVAVISRPDATYSYNWDMIVPQEGLVNTMRGIFVDSFTAFKEITKDPTHLKSMAISRKLLLTWNRVSPPVLFYRNDPIGYTEDGKVFKIADHKKYLIEELIDMENLKVA